MACLTTAEADVEYTGLEQRLETNVRAFSALETTACDSARWRVERLFRDADDDGAHAYFVLIRSTFRLRK